MGSYRSVGVLVSVVALAAGAVVAVNAATTTEPVKLCANDTTGAVSLPRPTGACPQGTTKVFVANSADVRALAKRMDALEGAVTLHGSRLGEVDATNTEQADDISALEGQVAELQQTVDDLRPADLQLAAEVNNAGTSYVVRITGTRLKPDSPVALHFTSPGNSGSANPVSFTWGAVGSDGNFSSIDYSALCSQVSAYATGLAPNGDTITSNVIEKGPACM
jgi:uncharacterized coiled-coil protein SlyX